MAKKEIKWSPSDNLGENFFGLGGYYDLIPREVQLWPDQPPIAERMKNPKVVVELAGISVLALSEVDIKTAHRLVSGKVGRLITTGLVTMETESVKTYINYPIRDGVRIEIEQPWIAVDGRSLRRHPISVGVFLWHVAQVYRRIYREAERYGVWGHNLSHLSFEGIEIYGRGKHDTDRCLYAKIRVGS